jgi:hypothetical protein
MSDPAGRRWVNDILAECHVWHTSFASNGLRMAFLEGERSQGLRILTEVMEANPDAFLTMLKERASERPAKPRGADADAPDADPFARAGAEPEPGPEDG